MPEGHTVHRIAADQNEWFSGQKIALLSPQGRFSTEADVLSGLRLKSVEAFGKHLFYVFTTNRIIHVHLGLYGKFRVHTNPPPEPRGAVRMRVIGSRKSFDLNGPNQCELIDSEKMEHIIQRLGPDPLRPDADPHDAWRKMSTSTKPIGAMLLDQAVIAGIGNIYRCEILFLLSINPQKPSNELNEGQFQAIWDLTCRLLEIGKINNRIVTTIDLSETDGDAMIAKSIRRSERLNIYKKPFCPKCGDYVYYWQLANRTVYSCDNCQQ